jgi:hypothetical protein
VRSCLILVLLCPVLFAGTLSVQGEAGDWKFQFRVPEDAVVSGKSALRHSDFVAWHRGLQVETAKHKVEFSRGPWGYTFTVQANEKAPRVTMFNHTSIGELCFDFDRKVVRFRPGWYRFGEGHTIGVNGAQAILRIEGGEEPPSSGRLASSGILLLAGLLAGGWIAFTSGRRPHDPLNVLAEPGIGPRHPDENHA